MGKDGERCDPATSNEELRDLVTMRMVRLFVLLRRAGVLAQKRLFELSEVEWRIMVQLGDTAPLSLNQLADALVQDRGQLSRAVKAMVTRGLLTRERKPGGPEIEIGLSKAGQALHVRMVDAAVERDQRLTAGFDQRDLDTVRAVTDAMIDHAEAMFAEEQQAGA